MKGRHISLRRVDSTIFELAPSLGFRVRSTRLLLSWDLLDWLWGEGTRIPYFFTNFITTPELSGPLYIKPDIYHTQITEYLLESICIRWALFSATNNFPNCYSVRLSSKSHPRYHLDMDWRFTNFREHISHALPTERIFYQLRSIGSDRLMRGYAGKLIQYLILLIR